MDLKTVQDRFYNSELSEEEIRDLVQDQIDSMLDDSTVPEIQDEVDDLENEFQALVRDVMSQMA
jgi:polyhydroxyalkanoate synthesis regulator phasin